MINDRILLIRTGGTVDSEPYPNPYNPPKFVETLKGAASLIMPTVEQLPNGDKVDQLTWGTWYENRFVKDSQKYTNKDIRALADIIRSDPHRYFVLTHGTDFMQKNASALQKMLKSTDKTIMFVGAMNPLSMNSDEHPSDILGALKFTMEHIARQPAGVYVVGRDSFTKKLGFFNPDDVRKDRSTSLRNLDFTLRVLTNRKKSYQDRGM